MFAYTVSVCWELFPGPSLDTTIRGCPSPLYTVAQYLHVTFAHPPVYFESSLVYLEYLMQCKGYGNSCQRSADSGFAFWNFLEFFLEHFQSSVEPVDVEGLYSDSC